MASLKKPVSAVVVLFSAVLCCTACRGEQSQTPSAVASAGVVSGGELVASLRSSPATFNRYADRGAAGDLLATLTHATLVRVNRATDAIEPWLAERWSASPDGLAYTLALRQGIAFSDGQPFTSADVVFSFAALYDERTNGALGAGTRVGGKPLEVSAAGDYTVTVRFPEPFAPGIRLLDAVPILPRHKLEAAFKEGRFAEAWNAKTPLDQLAGLGPFQLAENLAGQRLVFTRNPRYWRTDENGVRLPYLDRLTVRIVPDQGAEALQLQSGQIDLMSNGDIRADDYPAFKRASDAGKLRLIDGGVGLDPNVLWFNLSPARKPDSRKGWLTSTAFRQAISCAIDREAIVNAVYAGAAVPVHGPISPGNKTWFFPGLPVCNHDLARARTLLASAGLTDRNADGTLEDAAGSPARFSIITQRGHTIRERTVSMIQQQLRALGIVVDIVALDTSGIRQRLEAADYDSIYYGVQMSSTDPALNQEFWLSSGSFHFWNPDQPTPGTPWEAKIDSLMRQCARTTDLSERQRLFAEVQKTFAEQLPAIYFAAPKVTLAVSTRVVNARPAPQIPQLLWSAETLAASPGPRASGQ